jgi:pyruvate kinase
LKGASLDVPALTERDEEDILEFGIKQGVDFIAISNIRRAKDLEYTRELLSGAGGHIKLISKIQN